MDYTQKYIAAPSGLNSDKVEGFHFRPTLSLCANDSPDKSKFSSRFGALALDCNAKGSVKMVPCFGRTIILVRCEKNWNEGD